MVVDVPSIRKTGDTGIELPSNTGKAKAPQKKGPKQVSLSKFVTPESIHDMRKMGDDSVVSFGAPKPITAIPQKKEINQVTFDAYKKPVQPITGSGKPLAELFAGTRSQPPTARQVEWVIKAANTRIAQLKQKHTSGELVTDSTNLALYNGLLEARRLAALHRLGPENHAQLITAVREKVEGGEKSGLVINQHLDGLVKRLYDLRKNGINVVK
jgi:hypothetical protein